MMSGQMTPLQIVAAAEALIKIPQGGSAGLWPRTAAVLGRQAIESALRQYWGRREPGLEHCSSQAQLLCLVAYLSKRELAQETSAAWSALSRACHHHPYELRSHGWRVAHLVDHCPDPCRGGQTAGRGRLASARRNTTR